ncbi:orotidine 5'-phosphate decarboxylase [Aliidongia dinghuensis]|uniref:Orotidine 5'-phosphate decarboxylase n=1 Tax=Aliidongia dinghuensis TaxID=1867774 RepID=A0A8J3E7I4_9PROT|nr:orotidine-5'-phosphate decarboxylase [Aliidongia dinghuensis]GGF41840.1 orotidine 5'-phosphate decarboxylase [Aliidongia dinghuensis]
MNPVFAALDTTDLDCARGLAAAVAPHVGGLKLGLEFFLAQGLANTAAVAGATPLFLDLKLHDIPNTVAGGVRAIAGLKPEFLTIHTAGGSAMMRAAVDAAAEAAAQTGHRIKLLGVTVLTSLDDGDLDAVGQRGPAADQVRRLALLARASGLDGVICSPMEVAALRADLGADFQLVVPGIRPAGAALGDQKRVMGPRDAIAAGASRLVIGRPITEAPDPAAAARAIAAELAA